MFTFRHSQGKAHGKATIYANRTIRSKAGTMHIAVLDALMASRPMGKPGKLVFQGVTSLHFVHGSPCYSEDLNFLVDSSLKLDTFSQDGFASMASKSRGGGWNVYRKQHLQRFRTYCRVFREFLSISGKIDRCNS